jgi:hypothetical protein
MRRSLRSVDVGCGVGLKATLSSSVKLLIITETSGGRGRVRQC